MIEDRFKDTFIRFPSKSTSDNATRERLMPLLYHVYRFESSRVAGAHGGSRLLDQCLWTKAEILPHLPIQVGQTMSDLEGLLDELIAYLSSDGVRHLLRFKSAKRENEYVHITRVAEMIRTTGNLHEFHDRDSAVETTRKYNIIEGTQWYPLLRYGMPREFPPSMIRSKLETHLSGRTHLPQSKGGHSISDALDDVDLVLKSIGSMSKFSGGNGLMFSKFQVDGIVKTLLVDRYNGGSCGHHSRYRYGENPWFCNSSTCGCSYFSSQPRKNGESTVVVSTCCSSKRSVQ